VPSSSELRERSWWRRFAPVEPGEIESLLWSCLLALLVFTAYYILRPLRDAIGSEQDLTGELPWVVTATLVGMLLGTMIFSLIASHIPRRWVLPACFQFFVLNLLGLYVLLATTSGEAAVWAGRTFYVWVGIFNLITISTMWSVLADVFTTEQAKRLFGVVSVGVTIGVLTGSQINSFLVQHIHTDLLLLLSALLLQCAAVVGWHVARLAARRAEIARTDEAAPIGPQPLGGKAWSGLVIVSRSPYLLMIAAYIFLYTTTSTFLYFEQTRIMQEAFTDRASRSAFSANVTFTANLCVLGMQLFLTAHIVRFLGMALTLMVTPLVTIGAFAALDWRDTTVMLMAVLVTRSSLHYAVDKPSREMLYTVVQPEAKYKAKNFIDTFIYRGGDTIGGWIYAAAAQVAGVVTFAAIGACVVWSVVAWALAQRFERVKRS